MNIVGTEGNDSLTGGPENDVIDGRGGNDTINGGGGNDSLIGGTGDDTFVGNNTGFGFDTIDGGAGFDTEIYRGGVAGAGIERIILRDYEQPAEPDAHGNELDNIIIDEGPGNAYLYGNGGNDTLIGGSGLNLFVFTGNPSGSSDAYGHDSVDGGGGIDWLLFENNSAAVTVDFRTGTVTGGSTVPASVTFVNVERAQGTLFNDVMIASDNGNTLGGYGGSDTLTGGAGNDNLSGDSGFGHPTVSPGDDRLSGGGGNDTIAGEEGSDWIDGGAGNDQLFGGGGDINSDGSDHFAFTVVPGAANADQIAGFLSGSDKIVLDGAVHANAGASGNFAPGDDRFMAGPGFTSGREGSDRVVYDTSTGRLYYDADGFGSGAAQLIATLQGAPALAATDIVIERNNRIVGTAGNDTLVGTAGDDILEGRGGNDRLDGRQGNDRLEGEAGADRYAFSVGPGTANADTIVGFVSGTDRIVLSGTDHPNAMSVGDFAAGDDRFMAGPGFTSGREGSDRVVYDTSSGNLYYDADGFGPGAAQLVATLQGAPTLRASDITIEGPLRFVGTGGNDTLVGTSGDDIIEGRGGNDRLDGRQGNDRLEGEAGADRYAFTWGPGTANADTIVGFVSGSDRIALSSSDHFNIGASGDFAAGDDRFMAGAGFTSGREGSDRVVYDTASGRLYFDADGFGPGAAQLVATLAGAPLLQASDITVEGPSSFGGTAGADAMAGTDGDDVMASYDGNDTLVGGRGNDTLLGGSGNDRLDGRQGNDRLEGEAGADFFTFSWGPGAENADTIVGFTSGIDRIGLSASDHPNIGAPGSFAPGDDRFMAGAGFTSGREGSDRVVYDTSTGNLYYDADGFGAGTAQLIATLQGAPALAASDIAVI